MVIAMGFPVMTSSVYAQTSPLGASSTIIPPSASLFADPGQTLAEQIIVRNESGQSQTYNISSENFTAQGVYGEVALVNGSQSTTYSLAQWITPGITSFTIGAHQEKVVPYTINIPNGAEPGGKYGAIVVQSAAGNTPGAANVSNSQASLILLRVSGDVTENASITSFKAPSYSEYGPVPIGLEVKDTGDVHIHPQGQIIITDMFGAKVGEINLNGQDVLPGAERIMTTNWTNKNPIGRFTATLVATYGTQSKALSATTTFIVFPKPLAIGIVVAIAAFILLCFLVVAGRKRISKALKVIAQG